MRQSKRKFLTQKPVRRPKLRNVIRWVLYAVCIFLAFVTANGGDFTKPLLLIPIALFFGFRCSRFRRHRHSVRAAAGYFLRHAGRLSQHLIVPDLSGSFLYVRPSAAAAVLESDLADRSGCLCGDRFRLRLSVCDLGLSPGFPAVSAPHAPLSGVYRHQQHDLLSSLFSDSPFPAAKAAAYH